MRTPSPLYCRLDLAPPLADQFICGVAPSITARYFSSCPSDSASRRTPCPPGSCKWRLQVRLGCVRLSPSCPFRLLHTFHFPRPATYYRRFWIQRPSSERRRDLNPPDQCAAQRKVNAGRLHSHMGYLLSEKSHLQVQQRPEVRGELLFANVGLAHARALPPTTAATVVGRKATLRCARNSVRPDSHTGSKHQNGAGPVFITRCGRSAAGPWANHKILQPLFPVLSTNPRLQAHPRPIPTLNSG